MGSYMFSVICILHSLIAITCGSLIMFYLKEIYVIGHGVETMQKLSGSTPHDQLLIQVSNSFTGLLLFVVGFLLFLVAFVKDVWFQSFLLKGVCFYMYQWLYGGLFLREGLKLWLRDWLRQVVGDFALAFSCVFFLVYTWREKYD